MRDNHSAIPAQQNNILPFLALIPFATREREMKLLRSLVIILFPDVFKGFSRRVKVKAKHYKFASEYFYVKIEGSSPENALRAVVARIDSIYAREKTRVFVYRFIVALSVVVSFISAGWSAFNSPDFPGKISFILLQFASNFFLALFLFAALYLLFSFLRLLGKWSYQQIIWTDEESLLVNLYLAREHAREGRSSEYKKQLTHALEITDGFRSKVSELSLLSPFQRDLQELIDLIRYSLLDALDRKVAPEKIVNVLNAILIGFNAGDIHLSFTSLSSALGGRKIKKESLVDKIKGAAPLLVDFGTRFWVGTHSFLTVHPKLNRTILTGYRIVLILVNGVVVVFLFAIIKLAANRFAELLSLSQSMQSIDVPLFALVVWFYLKNVLKTDIKMSELLPR